MTEKQISCSPKQRESAGTLAAHPSTVLKPRYSSHYSDDHWEVAVEMPGVKKENLHVTVENEIMEIEATRFLNASDGWKALGDYPDAKRYRLRLDVGPEVDPGGITAELTDGVLDLRLPLRDEVKPRTIEVK